MSQRLYIHAQGRRLLRQPRDWWLAPSLICSSRWGRVNRNCKIPVLFVFLFSFGCVQTTALPRKILQGMILGSHNGRVFPPPFHIYSATSAGVPGQGVWREPGCHLDGRSTSFLGVGCLRPHPDTHTHKSKPRGCDDGLHSPDWAGHGRAGQGTHRKHSSTHPQPSSPPSAERPSSPPGELGSSLLYSRASSAVKVTVFLFLTFFFFF